MRLRSDAQRWLVAFVAQEPLKAGGAGLLDMSNSFRRVEKLGGNRGLREGDLRPFAAAAGAGAERRGGGEARRHAGDGDVDAEAARRVGPGRLPPLQGGDADPGG